MLAQKIPRQLSTLSAIQLFPEPKICFSKNFVQRRWVYSVVETTSYVKIKKSETYRKEIRSQTDELKRRNTLKKEHHLLHKTKTDDKNKKPLSYTPFAQLVFCSTKPSFYPLLVNKPSGLVFYCSNPLLFFSSIVQCSPIVLHSYCSTFQLF